MSGVLTRAGDEKAGLMRADFSKTKKSGGNNRKKACNHVFHLNKFKGRNMRSYIFYLMIYHQKDVNFLLVAHEMNGQQPF